MADEKVSEMDDLPDGIQDGDYIPVVRPGDAVNYKATGAQIKAAASGLQYLDDFE